MPPPARAGGSAYGESPAWGKRGFLMGLMRLGQASNICLDGGGKVLGNSCAHSRLLKQRPDIGAAISLSWSRRLRVVGQYC